VQRRTTAILTLWVAIQVAGAARSADAATLLVGPSGPYSEIQAAIMDATPGDTVLVLPGTYLENLDFAGKSLVLVAESGPLVTTIDGSAADAATIRMVSGEDSRTSIIGFTITGGRGHEFMDGLDRIGGGVTVVNSSASILGNLIKGNTARSPAAPTTGGFGGGVYCSGGIVRIIGNEITDNVAGNSGGGIQVRSGQVFVEGNFIHGNSCTFGDGGGLTAHLTEGHVDIRDNRICANFAGDHGGGLYLGSAHPQLNFSFSLERNIISDNLATSRSATFDAGGGCWIAGMNGSVRSNTFARNLSVAQSPPDGSGLAILSDSNVDVQFNLLALNRPGAALVCASLSDVTLQHNLFWGNLPADVSGSPCAEQVAGSNLLADPQFCDSLGSTFSLAASSPALLYPLGPIGAVTVAGCPGTAVVATTWSQIKNLRGFRAEALSVGGPRPKHPGSTGLRLPILFLSGR